jgi:hypothetical protein
MDRPNDGLLVQERSEACRLQGTEPVAADLKQVEPGTLSGDLGIGVSADHEQVHHRQKGSRAES